jgi:hypothetical protein
MTFRVGPRGLPLEIERSASESGAGRAVAPNAPAQEAGELFRSRRPLAVAEPVRVGEVRAVAARAFAARLSSTRAWKSLDNSQRARLSTVLRGSENELSRRAREIAGRMVDDPDWGALTAATQASLLSLLLTKEALPKVTREMRGASGEPVELPKLGSFRLGESVHAGDFEFFGASGPALKTNIALSSGESIEVITSADGSGRRSHSLSDIGEALTRIPLPLRPLLSRVIVNPVPNPADAYWTSVFKDYMPAASQRLDHELKQLSELNEPERAAVRGIANRAFQTDLEAPPPEKFESFATAMAPVVYLYPTPYTRDANRLAFAFIHELGHFWSMTLWGPNENLPPWETFREAVRADAVVAPSRYGATNLLERAAETTVPYFVFRDRPEGHELRSLFKHTYGLLDQRFGPAAGSG